MGAPSGNAGSRKPHRVSKRDWRTEVYATAHPVCPHLWNPAQKSTRSRMLFRLGRIEWWRALTLYVKAASVNTLASATVPYSLGRWFASRGDRPSRKSGEPRILITMCVLRTLLCYTKLVFICFSKWYKIGVCIFYSSHVLKSCCIFYEGLCLRYLGKKHVN